ncbi:hypothetical protein PG997_004472 [Apiospora hydei]|uniref:Uncharacterized protein n=1 Tax=Apiospora hydei TaxID=1337664 RepID=A0ABR1X270_9PEZI
MCAIPFDTREQRGWYKGIEIPAPWQGTPRIGQPISTYSVLQGKAVGNRSSKGNGNGDSKEKPCVSNSPSTTRGAIASVRRSRQQADSVCDDCAIKARGLRPHRVGDGANLPRRKVADESFRKERPDGGRRSPKHKRRNGERKRHSGHSQYTAIPTNANAWIPNLYDEAKQLPSAPPPEYGRKYAPAPPVCPPRPSRSAREPAGSASSSSRKHHEKKSGGSSSSSRGRHGKSSTNDRRGKSATHDQHGKSSTSDYSTREDWPLRAPAEPRPALRPGGLRTQGPNGPPSQCAFATPAPADARPVRPEYTRQRPTAPPAPSRGIKQQEAFAHPLRREQRHVQRHPPPPLKIRPPQRQPLYMEYLEEQNSEMAQRYGSWKPPAPLPTPTMKPKPAEASEGIGVLDQLCGPTLPMAT